MVWGLPWYLHWTATELCHFCPLFAKGILMNCIVSSIMGKIPETRSQEISLIFQKKNKLKWEWNLKNILDWLIGGYWHLPIPPFTASVDFCISWHPCWQDSCVTMHAYMLSRFSRVRLCATLWTVAHQAPLSTGYSRQEYWIGLPFPSPNIM